MGQTPPIPDLPKPGLPAIPLPSTDPQQIAMGPIEAPANANRPYNQRSTVIPPEYEQYADPNQTPLGPQFAEAVQLEHNLSAEEVKQAAKASAYAAEYVVDRSPIGAYLRTFGLYDEDGNRRPYSTVAAQACAYVQLAHVRREVEIAEQLHREACKADAQRVLDEMVLQAFADPLNAFKWSPSGDVTALPIHKLPAHLRRMILDYKVRTDRVSGEQIHSYKFAPRQEMFTALCEHLGINNGSADLEDTAKVLMAELQRFQSTLNRPPADGG